MTRADITATGIPAAMAESFGPWSCCAQSPGAVAHPGQLPQQDSAWLPASVPGTAAAALRAAGRWDFDRPVDFDAQDWWYRTTFDAPDLPAGHLCRLCFDGLSTIAEIFLNGQPLLTTDNMFRSYRVEVGPYLRPTNDLVIGFRSLAEALQTKRPRPRWKTALVSHQQLRWHRTTLLGRIPGWSPPVAPVGPWRAVRLDVLPWFLSDLRLHSRLEGDAGVVTFHVRVHSEAPVGDAVLTVGRDEGRLEVLSESDGWLLQGNVFAHRPALWWPQSHGGQPLTECTLHFRAGEGAYTVRLGDIGFRRVSVPDPDHFSVHVNAVPVYCRGACWTVTDVVSLNGSPDCLARDLRLARDAGVNMLRVGGTMIYESDEFYRLCDELGILVWQDFMFANMDYPVEDPAFAANVEAEAREQLSQLSGHPCLAVLCGNSEVEQQAAMVGVPREAWRNRWFGERLPALCAEYCPDVPYVPSTPSGGDLPFHVGWGIAHYYGVGAYLRSPAELRQADVKFSPECLGFANVPEPSTAHELLGGAHAVTNHLRWKQRVPRDTGAGWDFEDVRDFYLHFLFDVDAVRLRSFDPARYLQLSRVVPGEMMSRVFGEWRGGHSHNAGGLVWFFKDLWPGAGWGILDSHGLPKASYFYLRRSWLPRQIAVTDEGLDGLHVHVCNETPEALRGYVELLLLKDGHVIVARGEAACEVPPRGKQTWGGDALLGSFYDVTYAYRFGPPKHDLVVATLFDEQRRVLSEAFYFVGAREPGLLAAAVDAEAKRVGEGRYRVALRSDRFLQGVSFGAKGFLPNDNYFHLVPGRTKDVELTARNDPSTRFRAYVEALNLRNPVTVRLTETT